MREIKFRAWDKVLKRMKPVSYLEWIKTSRWQTEQKLNVGLKDTGISDSERRVLMQFTGLKDKNGKEIYEGDIVQYLNGKGKIVWASEQLPGVDRIAGFYFYVLDGESGTISHVLHLDRSRNGDSEYEIIGNIHENPNLLKD